MSNGNGGNNCKAAVRNGNNIHLTRHDVPTNIQDSQEVTRDNIEQLAVMSVQTYAARLALAKETRIVWPGGEVTADPRVMFDRPEEGQTPQYASLTPGELYADARYLDAGFADEIPDDQQPHINYESMPAFPGEVNPYTGQQDVVLQPAPELAYANAA
jgi:hypothetical protein